jgi:hypothetical protein
MSESPPVLPELSVDLAQDHGSKGASPRLVLKSSANEPPWQSSSEARHTVSESPPVLPELSVDVTADDRPKGASPRLAPTHGAHAIVARAALRSEIEAGSHYLEATPAGKHRNQGEPGPTGPGGGLPERSEPWVMLAERLSALAVAEETKPLRQGPGDKAVPRRGREEQAISRHALAEALGPASPERIALPQASSTRGDTPRPGAARAALHVGSKRADDAATPGSFHDASSIEDTDPHENSVVHITIGRIDVRAVSPPAPSSRARAPAHRPSMSLSEYLQRRNQGRS